MVSGLALVNCILAIIPGVMLSISNLYVFPLFSS